MSIPLWALVHLPVVVTLSTAAFTPNGWVHSILYVLFENAMGIVKLGAVIAGGLSDIVPYRHCACTTAAAESHLCTCGVLARALHRLLLHVCWKPACECTAPSSEAPLS